MESIHVALDDKKMEGLQSDQSHEILKFDNMTEIVDESSDDEDIAIHVPEL